MGTHTLEAKTLHNNAANKHSYLPAVLRKGGSQCKVPFFGMLQRLSIALKWVKCAVDVASLQICTIPLFFFFSFFKLESSRLFFHPAFSHQKSCWVWLLCSCHEGSESVFFTFMMFQEHALILLKLSVIKLNRIWANKFFKQKCLSIYCICCVG